MNVAPYIACGLGVIVFLSGCITPAGRPTAGESRNTRHFQQSPHAAAACFARNAEEHSSALSAEIRTASQTAQVTVRVKNGVLYATADFKPAAQGSTGTIVLNVTTSGRQSDLVDALTEGC